MYRHLSLCFSSSTSPTPSPAPAPSRSPLASAVAGVDISPTIQALEHSVNYLLSQELHAQAVGLYSAYPLLHSPPLSLRLLHCLPYSPSAVECRFTSFASALLAKLHSAGHLQPVQLDELYKQLVGRGHVQLATLCFRLLCRDGLIPPSLSELAGDERPAVVSTTDGTSRPAVATARQKAAVYARLMLLQTYSAQRVITAASHELPVVVHAPITHITLVLTAWCSTVQQRRQQQQAAVDETAADDATAGEPMLLGEAEVAMVERDWHPFLWQTYCRAVEYRSTGSTAGQSHHSTNTPLVFLPVGRVPASPHSVSSPASAVSLDDCCLIAEHMRFLSFLRSSTVLSFAPRLLFLSAHLLLYHLALLSSLCRDDVGLSAALLDAQLFIHSALLRQVKVEPSLLTINSVLSSWATHLNLRHTADVAAAASSAAGSGGSLVRHSYGAFYHFFTDCFPSFVSSSVAAAAAAYSSRRPKVARPDKLQPNADSLLPFVAASTLYPSLAAPQLTAHAARTALALRQKKAAVSSPSLLLMEQPLRHIQAMQQGRQAYVMRGGPVDEAAETDSSASHSQAGEGRADEGWDKAEWQRVSNRARRGNRPACAAVVRHYLRSFNKTAECWSASPYLDCSPAGRLPTFRLLFHCTGRLCDLSATQTAWAHLLTLCPHPSRPLPWLYLSALCHSHLRSSRSPPHRSQPPPLSIASFLSAFSALCHFHALPLTPSCRSLVLHLLLSTYLSPSSAAYAASGWKRELVSRVRTEAHLVRDMGARWRPAERERLERVRVRRRRVEGQRVDGEERELSRYEREALLTYVKELQELVVADERMGVRGEWDKRNRIGGVMQLPAIAMHLMNLPHFPIITPTQRPRR